MLVFGSHNVGAIAYDSLKTDWKSVRFVEDGIVPQDSQIVDHTWLYVNKNGTPDRRFSNNRQLPVALYGAVLMESGPGFRLELQTSSVAVAEGVAKMMALISEVTRRLAESQANCDISDVPEADESWDTPESPASQVAQAVRSFGNGAANILSLSWCSRLPDWLQPVVWGVAVAIPLLAVGIRVALGAALMPWHLLTAVIVTSLCGLVLSIGQHSDNGERGSQQPEVALRVRDPRVEEFRSHLIKRVSEGSLNGFRMHEFAERYEVSRKEAADVADELYVLAFKRIVKRHGSDAPTIDREQRLLKSLAAAFEIDANRVWELEAGARSDTAESPTFNRT
jgi:hypothetical protein